MDKNILIREYREGDEVSILKLRGLVLSSPKDMDWWIWQHKQNPAGHAVFTIAEDEGEREIVGHFGYIPLKFKIESDICLVVAAVDSMVRHGYRGYGIYSQSRQELLKIGGRNNFIFEYSFPNLNMLPINRKYGITPVFQKTPLWVKPLRVRNVVTRYLKNGSILASLITAIGKGLVRITDRSIDCEIRTQVREVKEIDERFDTLWHQASSHHKIMLIRDRAYLDWRYVKKPDADYTIYISEDRDKLLGYIVLRTIVDNGLRIGWIVDILTSYKDNPASIDLLTKAVQYFKAIGIDMVLCVMPPKAYLAASLIKHGFLMISKWRRHKYQIFCEVIIPKYPESLLHNPDNWYLTRGDSDLI